MVVLGTELIKEWISRWGPNEFVLFGDLWESGRKKIMISLDMLDMFRYFKDTKSDSQVLELGHCKSSTVQTTR